MGKREAGSRGAARANSGATSGCAPTASRSCPWQACRGRAGSPWDRAPNSWPVPVGIHTLVEHVRPVGHLQNNAGRSVRPSDRHADRVDPPAVDEHLVLERQGQACGWLIEQQDPWVHHRPPPHGDHLPLATQNSESPLSDSPARPAWKEIADRLRRSRPCRVRLPPISMFSFFTLRVEKTFSVWGTNPTPCLTNWCALSDVMSTVSELWSAVAHQLRSPSAPG